jgi:tRNA A37 threonylcarbamoyladenosine synthetase subunit TsaC/SUA5/YrdC
MSGVAVVGAGQMTVVRAALQAGQLVGLPDVGRYVVAGGASSAEVTSRLLALASEGSGRFDYMVGEVAQARALSGTWDTQTERLLARCWPGPVVAMLEPRDTDGAIPIRVGMAVTRSLRHLCRDEGPLLVLPLDVASAAEAAARWAGGQVACVVDGGPRRGPGPTVVDCRLSPPQVREEGALPASFIEAALLMANRRRGLWARISGI